MENRQRNWINKYLMPDEYIIWNGKPGTGHLFTPFDIFMIPFSVIWCGGAISWTVSVLSFPFPFPFFLWGVPFICVGLYMVFGRFIQKSRIRKETIYVITNKRIFSFRKYQIQTLDYHTNLARKVTRHWDGSGSICYDSPDPSKLQGRFTPAQSSKIIHFELDNIPNVDHVLRILSN